MKKTTSRLQKRKAAPYRNSRSFLRWKAILGAFRLMSRANELGQTMRDGGELTDKQYHRMLGLTGKANEILGEMLKVTHEDGIE